MSALGARVPIGGLYGDITYPVTSPLAITMGFAASEAAQGNFADAMEAHRRQPTPPAPSTWWRGSRRWSTARPNAGPT